MTALLHRWAAGDAAALQELVPLVYPELKRIAAACLYPRPGDRTLGRTALVHEAYLRLGGARQIEWRDRGHFFRVAARLMRQILVEECRAKYAAKRSGERVDMDLDAAVSNGAGLDAIDMLALDRALTELEQFEEQKARIVELRYFTGLSIDETAQALEISPATVKRDWGVAILWLYHAMTGAERT